MKKTILNLATAAFLLGMIGCSDDSKDTAMPDANVSFYKGTQSPGDVWDWTLNHDENTFTTLWDYGTFDDLTDDIQIEGTFETLATGYLKCTITNVMPATADIPDDGSAFFYAMNLPGVAMMVKPEGSIKGDLIATVAAGDCADIAGDYNYILTAPGNGETYDPAVEEAYGQVTFIDNGDGKFSIHGDKYSLDCANEGPCTVNTGITGLPEAVCTENGAMVITSDGGATQIVGQFTGAGVMMMDRGKGNGGVLAFQKSAAYEFNDLVGAEMIGFAYLPHNNQDKTVAIQMTFEDTGEAILGDGHQINNIHTGELNPEGVTMRVDGINEGLLNGDLTFDSNEMGTNFVAAMLESGESKMLIVSSYDPDGSPFILVLVEK